MELIIKKNKRQQYFPKITLLNLPVNQLIKSIAHTGCLKFQWNTHPKVAPLGIDGDGRQTAPELLRRRTTSRPTRASSTEDKPKVPDMTPMTMKNKFRSSAFGK